LHWAVSAGSITTTQLLLNHGADPNSTDQTGETVLHWACANNNQSLVELLVREGANPDMRNKDDKLPSELTVLPGIKEICNPMTMQLQSVPFAVAAPGAIDPRFASVTSSGGGYEAQVNGLLARIAAEQKARAFVQTKLMSMSELGRTLEDYKAQFKRATAERKDAELRLQNIRPTLERERAGREEAERSLRDKRAQIEDLTERLHDANEKILVARKFAGKLQELDMKLKDCREKRDVVRVQLRDEQSKTVRTIWSTNEQN